MSTINYAKLSEIVVKSQKELDAIPGKFADTIVIKIKFGTPSFPAIVRKSYKYAVEASQHSNVVAYGNSYIVARDNSHVKALYNSHVKALDNSSVEACDNSSVEAWENSSVKAWDNSYIVARDNSFVEARGNSQVKAWDNSSVKACDNSSVEATGNSQIMNFQPCQSVCRPTPPTSTRINISGNSRIIHGPTTIKEYVSFYGIKHNEKTGHFFKAVHRAEDGYLYSHYDPNFRYAVNKTICHVCDPDVAEECSYGIHISTLDWALRFGSGWNNLTIIEVEADLDKVVVPVTGDGKVRTSEVKVLREVPLEECGIYGKMLARRCNQAQNQRER